MLLYSTHRKQYLCHECRIGKEVRRCIDCGKDLSRRNKRAKLCVACAADRQRLAKALNMNRKRLKAVPLIRVATKGVESVPDSAIEIIERIHAGERFSLSGWEDKP